MRIRAIVFVSLLLVTCGLWFFSQDQSKNDSKNLNGPTAPKVEESAPTKESAFTRGQLAPSTEQPDPEDPRLNRLPDGRVEYRLALATSREINHSPNPEETLEVIDELMAHYRYAYKENPVGSENVEITAQLLGANPRRIVFIAADNSAIHGNELVDQWGTPFFFHALSGQEMKVRSAGPDAIMWSQDDILAD
ncbi:MAG: hypothetical protein ACN4GF_01370 [Lentimonas sp.]